MEFFDGHADTLTRLMDSGESLLSNNLSIDYKRLQKYSSYSQFFAAFIDPEKCENAMEKAPRVAKKLYDEAKRCKITVCKNYADYINAKTRIKAFLSLEGGYGIDKLSDIKKLQDMGFAMIAPTWNTASSMASGVLDLNDSGLTHFGKRAICEMNRLGIIIDVSHCSKKSFWDIVKISKRPIVASHSNLKTVVCNIRNLTDEQFVAISKMGGVAGINFYPPFFGENILALKNHIDRMIELGGEDAIALGSDFDGVDALPCGLAGAEDIKNVIKSLPYSVKIKEKIAFSNLLRVVRMHSC